MLEFIVSNYIVFIVIAIVLLLGLFGYMMDKRKFKQYQDEILNDERALGPLDNSENTKAPSLDQIK